MELDTFSVRPSQLATLIELERRKMFDVHAKKTDRQEGRQVWL